MEVTTLKSADEKFHFENKIDQFLSLFMKRKNSYRLCVALCW